MNLAEKDASYLCMETAGSVSSPTVENGMEVTGDTQSAL